jgi:hypothetical protein
MDLSQKSDAMLKRTLGEYGGQRYALQAVKFAGSTTQHGNYAVHRDAVLVVSDPSGHQQELRLLGSMIESREGWKVFSYLADR